MRFFRGKAKGIQRGDSDRLVNNPWLRGGETTPTEPVREFTVAADSRDELLVGPQPGGVPKPAEPRLPVTMTREASPRLWCIGAHGGAGESTIAVLLEDLGARPAGHCWPCGPSEVPTVTAPALLVCRSSAHGLQSAQAAGLQWSSGQVNASVVGLVVIADAPGARPRPLRDLTKLVAGGFPRVWDVPWCEAWRLGEPVSSDTAPRMTREIHKVVEHVVVDESGKSHTERHQEVGT